MAVFRFIVPPGELSPEGGGAYLRGLTGALRAAGHGVAFGEGAGSAVIDGAALAATPLDTVRGAVAIVHHGTPLVTAEAREQAQAAEQVRLPLLRRVVATSGAVAERLVQAGLPPDRLCIIPPGVPDAAHSIGSGGDGCTVLTVGALVPRKGHDVLLRALGRLFDLPWRLVIVGDPNRDPATADALHAQAAALDGRVQFAGTLDDAALDAAWRGADLFALASNWEGYSAPVAEALRRGLPVAVTAGGAAAELVGPETGIVVQPGDADGLSKAMRRLVFDTGLRADMADAAWRAGQTLPGWPAQAERFVGEVAA